MINAQSVTKMFGPKTAVDNVSFEVKQGEVLGFLGPNGAGKSTTMRMLTGFIPMSSGKITIDEHDIAEDPVAAKALIGYLPENAPSYPDMTVEAFLKFIADAKGLTGEDKKAAVQKAIDTCKLEKVRKQTIDTLSKGYKHRTCFAQAILNDPPVLVLDEPTDGLDPNQKRDMRDLIKEMGKNKAIIVSTHILEEVEAICTRVIIIDKGKIVFNGTPAQFKEKSSNAGFVTVHAKNVPFSDFQNAVKQLPEVKVAKEITCAHGKNCFQIIPGDMPKDANLAAIIKTLMDKNGWAFDELHTEYGRLDEAFHSLTSTDTDIKEAVK